MNIYLSLKRPITRSYGALVVYNEREHVESSCIAGPLAWKSATYPADADPRHYPSAHLRSLWHTYIRDTRFNGSHTTYALETREIVGVTTRGDSLYESPVALVLGRGGVIAGKACGA